MLQKNFITPYPFRSNMQIQHKTTSAGGKIDDLTMTGEDDDSSLWINTPRGLIHVFIASKGLIDITIWNSKNEPATKIVKRKKSEGITYIKQVLK